LVSLKSKLRQFASSLEDASFNVENWLLQKASNGLRMTINHALLLGDGNGRLLGLLSPTSGIPVCETASSTPPGQFRLGLRRLCSLTRLSNS
jgi:hypothetical protein